MNDCREKVSSYVDTITLHCKTTFSAASCFAVLKTGQTEGQCLDTMEKVSPEEWSLRGNICNAHIMAPVVFVLVCGFMDFKSWIDPSVNLILSWYKRAKTSKIEICILSCCTCCLFPVIVITMTPLVFVFYFIKSLHFPFITKTKQMIIEWKMFGLHATRNPEDNESYNKKMEELLEEEDKNQKIETFSMISETAIESVFQFWFQSLYLMPTLVINILFYSDGSTKSTDLVNWQVVSILFSFVSIAWSAVKIRQVLTINVILIVLKLTKCNIKMLYIDIINSLIKTLSYMSIDVKFSS